MLQYTKSECPLTFMPIHVIYVTRCKPELHFGMHACPWHAENVQYHYHLPYSRLQLFTTYRCSDVTTSPADPAMQGACEDLGAFVPMFLVSR